jgi:tungstate transport system substrate-binding protein
LDRRELLAVGLSVAGLSAAGCSGDAPQPSAPLPDKPPQEPNIIRIASVKTAVEGGLLPKLVELFHAHSPYRTRITTGTAVYDLARQGSVDLVLSHYGHRDAESFVLDGRGEWPRTVFSNQMAIIGPPHDPAKIRGLEDAGLAFERIAASRSKFVVNDIDGVRYLTEILWNAAGHPDRGEWFIDGRTSKVGAMEQASEAGAYTIWGLTPFLRTGGYKQLALEPLVLGDPLLQRMLVSIVVNPGPTLGVNREGARAFQSFLLAPSTQAMIRTVQYPGSRAVAWVPAGRHNRTAVLPKT